MFMENQTLFAFTDYGVVLWDNVLIRLNNIESINRSLIQVVLEQSQIIKELRTPQLDTQTTP